MKKQILLLAIIASFLLTACNPRVVTHISKSYPPTAPSEGIAVFSKDTDISTFDAEILGTVVVFDGVATTNCDSNTVVHFAKKEARKVGGNAIFITRHQQPSFSNTCHKIEGLIVKLNNPSSILIFTDETRKTRTLPRMQIGLDGGYAWRPVRVPDVSHPIMQEIYNGLNSGPMWSVSSKYYFNDNVGIALHYSTYSANSKVYDVQHTATRKVGDLYFKDRIKYIGPDYTMRFAINKTWLFNVDVGLGYISYTEKERFLDKNVKWHGATLGTHFLLGTEYKFHKNWGIGVSASSTSGTLNKMTREENGIKSTIRYEGFFWLAHISALAGLRFYIN